MRSPSQQPRFSLCTRLSPGPHGVSSPLTLPALAGWPGTGGSRNIPSIFRAVPLLLWVPPGPDRRTLVLVTLGAQAEGGPTRPTVTVVEQDVQTYRTCDAPLEVTHALPPHPRARQLHGPHPQCTQPAPAGQGSYTAHTHHAHRLHPLARVITQPTPHAHGLHPLARAVTRPHTHHAHELRVQPSSAQGWAAGHIWCQAVTLTLPRLLPAQGYLGRREAARVDSTQKCAARGSKGSAHDANSVTTALCDGGCNQPRDKDPQPGS